MTDKKSAAQIINKVERYCAYQERCRQEVSIKLQQLGIKDEREKQKVISAMEKKGFVDELRYARAFSRDRFNLYGWGKIKIAAALQQKSIPQHLITSGLAAIDDSQYLEALKTLHQKKKEELQDENNDFIRKNRIASFLTAKGFEPDLVWKELE